MPEKDSSWLGEMGRQTYILGSRAGGKAASFPPRMPSLPSSPPPPPSILLSPVVGLGVFVGVVAGVTVVYAITQHLAAKYAARRVRRVLDAEAAGRASTVIVAGKTRPRTEIKSAAGVLVTARFKLLDAQAKVATRAYLVSPQQTLMAVKLIVGPITTTPIPATHAFLKREARQHAIRPFFARQQRTHPGPSPLRVVYCAPTPVVTAPAPVVIMSPKRTVTTPAEAEPAPIATRTLPRMHSSRARLLARVTSPTDDSDDSGSDYSDDDDVDEPVELAFRYDAARGVWSTASPPPNVQSPTPAPVHVQPQVLGESRRSNLRRVSHVKRPAAKAQVSVDKAKRASVSIQDNKENGVLQAARSS
ncbi:hypothetical protein B0H11DRAFT_2278899 [Mycena galericulata]|nr:hypothetical protein B0H11DRAFT_2278899 [Mycena galericulata]